ncbi:MAG: amidohydrolase family protein [Clostridiaceae bacterium]|nr:amidohydrolase family protein [Clostridiaceae bacterium]
MNKKKLLIKNGMVYDGTGSAGRLADVLVEGDRIAQVGEHLPCDGDQVINAEGYAVTPGFIDIHRHCDIAPFTDPDFGKLELAQGITSAVAGNCGLSLVPTSEMSRQKVYDYIEPVVGRIPRSMAFEDYGAYTEALRRQSLPLNMGFLAGAGAVKSAVKGFSRAPFTGKEMEQAAWFVNEAMEQGAFGMSIGIMYQPECYSTQEDYIELVKPVAKRDGILCTHIRGEGDSLVESVSEVIGIAKASGVRLNISHLKATGISNWNNRIWKAVDKIEEARAQGVEVTADFYPYTGGATTLLSLFPPSVLGEDTQQTVKFMETEAGKRKLKEELRRQHQGWDNMAASIGWERILISSVSRPEHAAYQGRTAKEVSESLGYDSVEDFIADLTVSEEGKVGIIVLSMSMEDVEQIAKLPYTILISDSLYGGGGNPHPRLYGAFPRFIREMVLEKKIMPLEQGIRKMTGLPAQRMKMNKKGILASGCDADILVFKPEELRDRSDYSCSGKLSEGIAWTVLGGEVTTGRNSGQGRVLEFGKC